MTTRSLWIRLGLLLTIPALLLLGACDTFVGSDDDHDDEDDHEEALTRVELQTRDGTDETLAAWTEDDGWDVEALPPLEEGGEPAVWTVRMFTEDEEFTLEEGGEYEARYDIADDASQDVIYFDDSGEVEIDGEEAELFHGDHVHVYPQNADTTRIRILLWHDSHSDGDTDWIDLVVEEAGSDS